MKGTEKLQGRLLILDDDALTAETIERIARFIGMEAQFTTNHRTFFQLLKSWRPDVIALDLIMPEMDGVEVLSGLAEQGCLADIILTSGVEHRVLESARRSADENGLKVIGLLSKPFSAAQLRELLARKDTPITDLNTSEPEPLPTKEPQLSDQELIDGINSGQFSYFYQPKVYCVTGMIMGFEALARWHHPRHGLQSPGKFIPEAERLGVITSLSRHLFETGLSWFASLRDSIDKHQASTDLMLDFSQLTLSLNVSALSLSEFSLFKYLLQLCEQYHISPEQLILEVTESCAMEDPGESLRTLTRLRMTGFQLAIDDFGTGYSSMLQLVRMPFSELKIDQSFVCDAARNAESRAVIRSMVELGRNMSMKVVAEGVEEGATQDFLRQIHCDIIQGYLISRPLPSEQVFAWLLEQAGRVKAARMAEASKLGIVNELTDVRFDRVTRLANRLLNVPVVVFAVIDGHKIWVKSVVGIEAETLSGSVPLFSEIVRTASPLAIEDLCADSRFSHIALPTKEGRISGFAGEPLYSPLGFVVGALSVMDSKPLHFSAEQRSLLKCLTKMLEIELGGLTETQLKRWSGLYSWEQFFKRAELTLNLCQQCILPVSLIFFRVSDPDQVNAVGEVFVSCCRDADLPGQIGEQEFVLLVVESDIAVAEVIIERICAQSRQRLGNEAAEPTLSYGVSTQDEGGYRLESMVALARENLYSE